MADKTDIPAVGEPKRLGIIGALSEYSADIFNLFGEGVTEIKREGDTIYYLVEHNSFAEMTRPAVLPFYSLFVATSESDKSCLRGVWSSTPFHVFWNVSGEFLIRQN